jgi:hypothetical protein
LPVIGALAARAHRSGAHRESVLLTSRKRDLNCTDVLINSFCARAVRQRFSTFSIPQLLRRIGNGIIV